MAESEFRGISVHYETWGAGHNLFMLHAGGGSGGQWQRVAATLQRQCRIVAPDLIGSGRTGAWPRSGELTHDHQADLVAHLVEQEGGGAVDIVGHSYGGAVAVRLILRRPELVRTLVLVEPVLTLLLREVGDPLYDEYREMAEGFLEHARRLRRGGLGVVPRLPQRARHLGRHGREGQDTLSRTDRRGDRGLLVEFH